MQWNLHFLAIYWLSKKNQTTIVLSRKNRRGNSIEVRSNFSCFFSKKWKSTQKLNIAQFLLTKPETVMLWLSRFSMTLIKAGISNQNIKFWSVPQFLGRSMNALLNLEASNKCLINCFWKFASSQVFSIKYIHCGSLLLFFFVSYTLRN